MALEVPQIKNIQNIQLDGGTLGVIHAKNEIGFVPRRFYFLKNVPVDAHRGLHSHKKLKQFFMALSGQFTIDIEGPEGKSSFTLDSDKQGLFLPPGYWRTLKQFSPDCVCGVFASHEYDEEDYIRSYDEFLKSQEEVITKVAYINFDRMIDDQLPKHEESFNRVMESKHYIMGPNLAELEKRFAHWIGCKYAVGVASGLDALTISMRAWELGEGDEVIVPANTYYASALAISQVGATPVFVDCDEENYNISFEQMKQALSPRTKAISVTHLYGNPCDMDSVVSFARTNKLLILEDSAQAHGASINGKFCGTIGDASGFSFYPTKNMGAFGDAGMVTTNNEDTYRKILKLRNYGTTKKYHFSDLGYNSRLDEMQAAFLLNKLEGIHEVGSLRQKLANIYLEGLSDLAALQMPVVNSGSECVWHVFCLRVKEGSRDDLIDYLYKKGIETNIHYPVPIHLQDAYKHLEHREGDFPVTEALSKEIISLPLDQYHKPKEIEYVVQTIREYFV